MKSDTMQIALELLFGKICVIRNMILLNLQFFEKTFFQIWNEPYLSSIVQFWKTKGRAQS